MMRYLSTRRQKRALLLLPFIFVAVFVPSLGIEYSDHIGFFAACCTTFSFVPQVWQTVKTRDTRSISLGMYMMFVVGVFCWLVYGIMSNDMPVTIANAVTLLLASIILILKVLEQPEQAGIAPVAMEDTQVPEQ